MRTRCATLVVVAACLAAVSLLAQQGPEQAPIARSRVPTVRDAVGDQTAIRDVLDKQVAAWNQGDVEGFMEGYWKSEELTFVTAAGVTRGWQNVIERYRRSYPDRKTMGTLSFSNLEIRVLSRDSALVLGRWRLQRDADQPEGHFTLVLRKFPEGWRIIHDHTTALATPPSPTSSQ